MQIMIVDFKKIYEFNVLFGKNKKNIIEFFDRFSKF